ncbi:MAG TPA: hypothetical protein VKX49_26685, partial [Bryobacteraceae bacterium]|nr:hypothetical protein [Bryobacteraceae bacterium]
APFPIGCMPNMLSHAMVYNRYGYALLGLVVLECFLGTERGFAAGLSSGIVCVSLLFVKPSYCLAGVALVSGSFLIQKNSWRRTLGLAIGAAAAVVAIMALLHFDLGALWADLRLMGSARGAGLSLWNFRWAFLRGSGEFLPLAMLAVLVTAIRDEPRPLFVTCLLWGVGAALLASNAQAGGYPLNALLALILLEKGLSALSRNDIPAARFPAPQSILILLALTCYLPAALGNASGLAYAVADSRRTPASSVARFRQAPLAHLVFYDTPDGTDADLRSNGHIYVNYVNDGVDLIQRVSAADETVFVLDMVNPFCYALQRRPARGGSPALSFNHTFNDRSKPSAQWLFGAADIVMVPKHPASAEPDAAALFRNYLPAIEVQLRLCAESDWWKLYKRPDRLGGCPAANEPSRSTETAAQ